MYSCGLYRNPTDTLAQVPPAFSFFLQLSCLRPRFSVCLSALSRLFFVFRQQHLISSVVVFCLLCVFVRSAQAQQNKLETLLLKTRPTASSVLLEIGCGWGSFALYAAKRTGCSVVGITLSAEQLKWAQQRLDGTEGEGVRDRVWFELVDYRLFKPQDKYFVHRRKAQQQIEQKMNPTNSKNKDLKQPVEDLKFDAIMSCEMVCVCVCEAQ